MWTGVRCRRPELFEELSTLIFLFRVSVRGLFDEFAGKVDRSGTESQYRGVHLSHGISMVVDEVVKSGQIESESETVNAGHHDICILR
jgi:hypothetical protein